MNIPPPSDGPTPETYHRGRKPFFGVGASVVVAVGVAWAFLRWKPSRVRIEGGSMAPTLMPDDWALTIPLRRPKVGDVVVVEHPDRPGYEMVKRLTAGPGDRVGDRTLGSDEWWIEGDFAAASTDSRGFGPVREGGLLGKVVLIYWPKERRGRV
jgi:nickel-type superoxide dismutase maturation protease